MISDQSDEKFAKTEVAVNNVITTITPDKKSGSESQHGTKTNFSIPDFIIQDSSCQHLGFLFQFELIQMMMIMQMITINMKSLICNKNCRTGNGLMMWKMILN